LEKLVADFKRALFGARSEKADPEQFELALEDIETAMAEIHAEDEALDPPTSRPAKPRNTNRGSFPKHLPRIEEVLAPDSTICGCGAERHVIGEDASERLDIIPAQFRVIRCPAAHVYMRERGDPPPEVCLPVLHEWGHPRTCTRPAYPGWHADRGHCGACVGEQIRGSSAAVSSGADLQPSGHRP